MSIQFNPPAAGYQMVPRKEESSRSGILDCIWRAFAYIANLFKCGAHQSVEKSHAVIMVNMEIAWSEQAEFNEKIQILNELGIDNLELAISSAPLEFLRKQKGWDQLTAREKNSLMKCQGYWAWEGDPRKLSRCEVAANSLRQGDYWFRKNNS